MNYEARIIGGDQMAKNGIVHVISIPLVPMAIPVL
jgi:hypothetical protein